MDGLTKCIKCGKSIIEGSKECKFCGAIQDLKIVHIPNLNAPNAENRLFENPELKNISYFVSDQITTQSEGTNSKLRLYDPKVKKICSVIAIFTVVSLITVGLAYVNKSEKNNNEVQTDIISSSTISMTSIGDVTETITTTSVTTTASIFNTEPNTTSMTSEKDSTTTEKTTSTTTTPITTPTQKSTYSTTVSTHANTKKSSTTTIKKPNDITENDNISTQNITTTVPETVSQDLSSTNSEPGNSTQSEQTVTEPPLENDARELCKNEIINVISDEYNGDDELYYWYLYSYDDNIVIIGLDTLSTQNVFIFKNLSVGAQYVDYAAYWRDITINTDKKTLGFAYINTNNESLIINIYSYGDDFTSFYSSDENNVTFAPSVEIMQNLQDGTLYINGELSNEEEANNEINRYTNKENISVVDESAMIYNELVERIRKL